MNDWVTFPTDVVERVKDSQGTPVEKAAEPDLGLKLIPKSRYTDRAYWEKEWDRLWTKTWNFGCHVNDIPESGDYFALNFGKESLLFVRTESNDIKGFYNVCHHRGNQICQQQMGCVKTIKCGFHHWEWNLDGSVKNIPDFNTFPQLDKNDLPKLAEFKVDVWEGLIFFNLDPNADPLIGYLEELPEHVRPYELEKRVCVNASSVEWDCNWKNSVDAFMESYHVQGIHPQLMEYLNDYDVQIDLYGKHSRTMFPYMYPSPRYEDPQNPGPILGAVLQAFGYDLSEFSNGDPNKPRKAIQKAKRFLENDVPHPYQNLNDDQLTDNYHYLIFPTLQFNIFAEANLMFRTRPHETDPEKCYFDLFMYASPEPGMEHVIGLPQYKHGEIALGEVVDQDARNLPFVQKGMRSQGFKGLCLSQQERRIRHFHKVLEEYMGED